MPGLTHDQIVRLQRLLRRMGLMQGRVSGVMDGATVRSLRRLQRQNGLTVTGRYDVATDQLLRTTFDTLRIGSQPIANMEPDTRKFIEDNYGYLVIYLRDPEIGPLIVQAAEEGWDEARLMARLQETDWWHEHNANERSWDEQRFNDPAEAARLREQAEARIRDQALRMGVHIRPRRLSAIVEESLRQGWSEDQINDAIVSESRYRNGDLPIGQINTDQQDLMNLRHRYLLPVNERNAYRFARRIAAGEMTMEDVNAFYAHQSALLYPHLAGQLMNGVTPMDLFDSQIAAVADELELDPDSIDLTDPLWSQIVSHTDENGNTRAMTIGEVRRLARQQPGFQRTDHAREQSANLAMTIAQSFGRFGS